MTGRRPKKQRKVPRAPPNEKLLQDNHDETGIDERTEAEKRHNDHESNSVSPVKEITIPIREDAEDMSLGKSTEMQNSEKRLCRC